MKRNLILFACVAVCCAMMVSCKNTKTAEPTSEEIQSQKQALADSVLAKIDELAQQHWNAQAESFKLKTIDLTDEEKMVKPDYLLDPSIVNTLVTKSQKVNAMAMLLTDIALCKAYDIPYDNFKEAALKLAAELNVPFDMEYSAGDEPISEKIKATYKACKQRGDVSLFWQFEHSVVFESIFILSQNPELFLSKITEEQWQAWRVVKQTRLAAVKELAKYDEEMAQFQKFIYANKPVDTTEDNDSIDQSLEIARQYYIANKDRYAAMRNALLQ